MGLCAGKWGAARGSPRRLRLALCADGGRPGAPEGLTRHALGRGPHLHARREGSAACLSTPCPRRGLPGGRSRHTHLLKSKGIVPSPPGVGALQARRAAAPRGSLPAANASSGRPAPAGRPQPRHSPLTSRRREVTLRAAHWAPPALDAPSAARLKGPAGRGSGGAGLPGSRLSGGKGTLEDVLVLSRPRHPHCVFLHCIPLFLSVASGKSLYLNLRFPHL